MFGKKKKTGQNYYNDPYGGMNGYDMNGYDMNNYGGMNNFDYMGMKTKKTLFHPAMVVASVIAAVIFFILGEVILSLMEGGVPGPIMIGVYFLVFGICLAVALMAVKTISGDAMESKTFVIILVCLAIFLFGGMLFEFLYELGGKQSQVIESDCIFVIDNSGSMSSNDPMQKRVQAIEEILMEKEDSYRYAVYTFGDQIGMIREMAPISEGHGKLEIMPNGNTPIVGVLTQIQEDIESGKLDVSDHARIVMLSDGAATDNGILFHNKIDKPLKYFAKNNIIINTVGLGSVDESLMQKIADKTGGIFVMAEDVSQLTDAMKSAAEIDADRTLLSYRPAVKLGWLYGILRVFFITALGLVFAGIKLAIVDNQESESLILICSIGGSILAGLLMELGINALGITPVVIHAICAVLIALTPAYRVKYIQSGGGFGASGMQAY